MRAPGVLAERMLAIAVALAVVVLTSSSACRGPNITDGSLRCGPPPGLACPPGYRCRDADNRCWQNGRDGGLKVDSASDRVTDTRSGADQGDAELVDSGAGPPTLAVTIQRSGSGTITGAGINCTEATCVVMVAEGSSLELQANPAAGSELKSWSGCTSTTGASCSLVGISAPTQVTATFALANANLAIVKEGNGSGTVTAMWAGGSLDCGATCSATIAPGTAVTLMATPGPGSTAAWTTPCTGSGPCMVTTAAQVTDVKVTFTLSKVAVTIQRTGNGRVTSADGAVSCTAASCTVSVDPGSSLALQAVPDADSDFKSWSGCTSVTGNTCTLSAIAAPVQVSATFALKNASLVIAKQGNGAGTVTASWAGGGALNCGATCSASIQPGTEVTLMATPQAGSTVAWAPPCSGNGACVVTVAATGTTVTATFTLNKYLLSVAVTGPVDTGAVLSTTAGVTINCGSTCSALVDHGTVVQLAATPSSKGVFAGFTGCPSASGTTCSATITAALSVSAAFKLARGNPCASPAECSSGFCVNNVCCVSACNGECEASCQTGTGNCLPRIRRTACGTPRTVPGPGGASAGTDVAYICDGMGRCTFPAITCKTGSTTSVSCDLNTRTCCNRIQDNLFPTCAATPACNNYLTSGDYSIGYSCGVALDCPLNQVCCYRSNSNGGHWAKCEASCTGGTVLP